MHDHINDIKENYLKMEKELVTQLNYNIGNHHLTAGTNREEIWLNFFRRIVPKKFNIARSVFIIDSNHEISNEVDIAIYDEQYTPYIFNYGMIKFIPIEAVSAVVQCKSNDLDKADLHKWVESIKNLKTSSDSVARLAGSVHIGIKKYTEEETGAKEQEPIQSGTTPIKILCYISNKKTNKDETNGREYFDIAIEAFKNVTSKKSNDKMQEDEFYAGNLKIRFNNNENLLDVLRQYNQADKKNSDKTATDSKDKELEARKIEDYAIEKEEKEYTLLSFIFQFNQMLMMINNPLFFPHKAYVDMFNRDGNIK